MTAPTTSARVFLIRHGETDWISGGKFASRTDIPLSRVGEKDIEFIRDRMIGENEVIDPTAIAKMYASLTRGIDLFFQPLNTTEVGEKEMKRPRRRMIEVVR